MKKSYKKKGIPNYIKRNILNLSIIAMTFLLAVSVNGYSLLDKKTESVMGKYMGEPSVSAGQAIVIDADTGETLYEKNADERAYPASTTKIMTAVIVIETMEKLKSPIDQLVTVPAVAVGTEGSSIYLAYDERVSIEDLLYGMMLRSGNDAAIALATLIGGTVVSENQKPAIIKQEDLALGIKVFACTCASASDKKRTVEDENNAGVERFVDMMNQKAIELGCSNTNYMNPNGLFDENHYTTARDMAIISAYAMKNKTFRTIAGAKEYQGKRAPDKYNYFTNKNKVVYQYEGGNGIKIGYTKASGRTLVASAKRGERQLICVVMAAPDWFNDAYSLMDYCFKSQ